MARFCTIFVIILNSFFKLHSVQTGELCLGASVKSVNGLLPGQFIIRGGIFRRKIVINFRDFIPAFSNKSIKTFNKCIGPGPDDVVQHVIIAGSCRPLIFLFIGRCSSTRNNRWVLQTAHIPIYWVYVPFFKDFFLLTLFFSLSTFMKSLINFFSFSVSGFGSTKKSTSKGSLIIPIVLIFEIFINQF